MLFYPLSNQETIQYEDFRKERSNQLKITIFTAHVKIAWEAFDLNLKLETFLFKK